MQKFIYKDDVKLTQHWDLCERDKIPFITVSNIDENYCEIFFDITNLTNELEFISNQIKEISTNYNNFFLIPEYLIERYSDQYYCFKFLVLRDHVETIANQLFEFLLDKI